MRFGREGSMWGRACYFARNANYSASYAYADNGKKKMFYSEVLIGDTVQLPQQNLIKPPNKPGTSIEYDSVQGHTGNSDVYMVYANQKAYPRYLVTFQ